MVGALTRVWLGIGNYCASGAGLRSWHGFSESSPLCKVAQETEAQNGLKKEGQGKHWLGLRSACLQGLPQAIVLWPLRLPGGQGGSPHPQTPAAESIMPVCGQPHWTPRLKPVSCGPHLLPYHLLTTQQRAFLPQCLTVNSF